MLKHWLTYPQSSDEALDTPEATQSRRQIILYKTFLRRCYETWYDLIAAQLPTESGPVVELGSGAGFMERVIPDLVKTELLSLPFVSLVCSGEMLPFADGSLRGLVMTNVLHHIPNVGEFFSEAQRCLRPGGRLVMIEPWVTPWSSLVYRHLHHEPFDPDATEWTFPSSGPLTGANGALPWMVFQRDRDIFTRRFPGLQLELIKPIMPLTYLMSGGLTFKLATPGPLFGLASVLERAMPFHDRYWAMFALIVVSRSSST